MPTADANSNHNLKGDEGGLFFLWRSLQKPLFKNLLTNPSLLLAQREFPVCFSKLRSRISKALRNTKKNAI